ncbi:MAG: HAD hydrolase-like protein [bacterium]|nr:HAD hydrolase-like protein [bacterium]
MRSKVKKVIKKLYIFDLDDTLRYGIRGKNLRSGKVSQQTILPNVLNKLRQVKKSRAVSVVVSNQGFPSFGNATELIIWKFAIYFQEHFLKNLVKDIRLDFYHPQGPLKNRYKNKRKPSPKLILELLEDHKIRPKQAVFIGNAETDKKAARNAGVDFIWAYDFFDWDINKLEINEPFGWRWKKNHLLREIKK